jgi:RiboL-PSP-HEPN
MIPIDDLSKTGWERRSDKLKSFVAEDGWLWSPGTAGSLFHDRLLTWMKSPGPESLIRYFKSWGVDDIFTAVTRSPTTRSALWLGVKGLVDLRNKIAHGDYDAQATQSDVKRYMGFARQFCERADRRLATQIVRSFNVPRPW